MNRLFSPIIEKVKTTLKTIIPFTIPILVIAGIMYLGTYLGPGNIPVYAGTTAGITATVSQTGAQTGDYIDTSKLVRTNVLYSNATYTTTTTMYNRDGDILGRPQSETVNKADVEAINEQSAKAAWRATTGITAQENDGTNNLYGQLESLGQNDVWQIDTESKLTGVDIMVSTDRRNKNGGEWHEGDGEVYYYFGGSKTTTTSCSNATDAISVWDTALQAAGHDKGGYRTGSDLFTTSASTSVNGYTATDTDPLPVITPVPTQPGATSTPMPTDPPPTPTDTPTPIPVSRVYYNSNYPASAVGKNGYTSSSYAEGPGSHTFTVRNSGFSCRNYTFTHWLNYTNVFNPGNSITVGEDSTRTLFAQWQPVVYIITYDYSLSYLYNGANGLNKGTVGNSYTNDQTQMWGGCTGYAENRTYNNPSPSKPGYDFLGWSQTKNTYNGNGTTGSYIRTGDTFGSGDENSWSNKTLYAAWEPKKFIVTFDYNFNYGVTTNPDGNRFTENSPVGNSYEITFATKYATLPSPSRAGYIFKGWYLSESGNNGSGTEVTIDTVCTTPSNHTLYAKWEPITLTISYIGTETPITSKTIKYGETYGSTRLPTVSETNKQFLGWLDKKDSYGSDWKSVSPSDICYHEIDFTVKAELPWLPSTVYFNYNLNWKQPAINAQGTSVTSKQVTYNQTYGDLPNPTREGYTFGGWVFDDGTTYGDTSRGVVTRDTYVSTHENHTLKARWIPDQITIILDPNYHDPVQ